MDNLHDIGVLGSGPAALSIAAACASSAAHLSRWSPLSLNRHGSLTTACGLMSYPIGCGVLVEHVLGRGVRRDALADPGPRPSVLPSSTRGNSKASSGTPCVRGLRVSPRIERQGLEHRPEETRVHTEDGSETRARVVIDASGARSPFIQRTHRGAPAFQTAFGLLLRAPNHGFDPNRMVLMDFREASIHASDPPSFLYMLPLGEDRIFIEETSLARRPAMRLDPLRKRLMARLPGLGLEDCERLGEEHCSIAMGLGLPTTGQSVVPFGAAGAMVHPASGYLISRVLRQAEPVAESILEGLSAGDNALAIASGNETLWPRPRRAVWDLYGFGLETLVGMSATEIARFFDAFFQLPQQSWAGFLSGSMSPSALGVVMTQVFRSLPASVQWHLVRTGLSAGAAPLVRSVLQTGAT